MQKENIFVVLTILSGFWFWQRFWIIFTKRPLALLDSILFGVSLLVLIIFLLFFLLLIENEKKIVLSSAIFSLGFLAFFPFKSIYLVAFVILFAGLLIPYFKMRAEKEDRIIVRPRKIFKIGLPFIILSISLFIAFFYYFNPLLKIGQDKIEIPSQIISFLMKPLSGMFSKVIPFYQPGMTIDEMLAMSTMTDPETGQLDLTAISPELLAKIQEKTKGGFDLSILLKDPEIASLLQKTIKEQAKKTDPRILAKNREAFAKPLGLELKGNETIEEVFAKAINVKIGELIGPYQKEISISLAVTLFFILKLALNILTIIILPLSLIIFSILKTCDVIKIEKRMKEGESITL